ncbi:hypothetical protein F4776DRAFT_617066 [Hypoxylon sp. NC0597]|nr:hypothetical protein F4776DRAFT_617066 [Hypoxylon sp. NC0597]
MSFDSHLKRTMSSTTTGKEVQLSDDIILLYFDLDEASAPEYFDGDSINNTGKSDKKPLVFKPIIHLKEDRYKLKLEQEALKENSSGGFGPYVWPWSSQVMIGPKERPRELDKMRKAERTNDSNVHDTTKYENDKNPLPSYAAGIDWGKELLQVYRPNGNH